MKVLKMKNANSNAVSLGKKIRVARINKGLKQYELADQICVTSNYVSLIEVGKKIPSLRITRMIADVLDVSIGNLLEDDYIINDLKDLAVKHDLDSLIKGLLHLKSIGLK